MDICWVLEAVVGVENQHGCSVEAEALSNVEFVEHSFTPVLCFLVRVKKRPIK